MSGPRIIEVMDVIPLNDLAEAELKKARNARSGRAATTVYGGHEHDLRQTLIALAKGRELADHANPGEATLLVLDGHVTLTTGEAEWNLGSGDYLTIPAKVHAVRALEDSTILLTVSVKR